MSALQNPDRRALMRLANLLRPHRWAVGVALAAMSGASLALLAVPLMVKRMLEGAMSAEAAAPSAWLLLAMTGILLVLGVSAYVSSVLLHQVSRKVCARLRSECVSRWLRASLGAQRDTPVGELSERLNTSLADIDWFLKSSLGNLLGVILLMTGGVAMLFWVSWKMAAVTALLAPVAVLSLRWIERTGRELLRRRRLEGEKLAGMLQGMILGLDVIKAFNAEEAERERFEARQGRLLEIEGKESYVASLAEPVLIATGAVMFLFVVFLAGQLIAAGAMTAAELVTFLVYLMFVLPNLRTLGLQLARWRHLKVAVEFLDDTARLAEETDLHGAVALGGKLPPCTEVIFDNVSFVHQGRAGGLEGLSFSIRPGEHVGVVGASGAGKSTILSLLLRFYDASGGRILLDGRDVAGCTRASVRDFMAYVPQDPVLFDGTILENVRLGRPGASENEVEDACRAAQALDFVRELPEGFLTPVGERGLKLSAGQRQRLAIARALLKDAPVLLLDEATSALDPQTERLFGEALDALAGRRTAIIVAHRLSTVRSLPRLLFLKDGALAAEGSHEELLARSSDYRVLVGQACE